MKHSTKVFSVLYRHPKSNLVQFLESLENSLTILNKQKLTYYISGDTNIDLLQNETNNNIKNYTDMLFSLGCLPLVKFPTCISNTSSTRIDHIYTNTTLRLVKHPIYCWRFLLTPLKMFLYPKRRFQQHTPDKKRL